MLVDFAALPPEVISGQMYSGPGAGPMLAAATAWEGLAGELHAGAAGYRSVIAGLSAGWQGPSSAAMAAAAAPYAAWLSTTAAGAEEAATRARAAAAAYEAAFAATVPPPVIAANRSLLAALLASNIFGQNITAIAAVEAQYGQLWAQDVAAMLHYAGSSVAATRLSPFTAAPQTANSSGPAAAATQTLSETQSLLHQALQAVNSLTAQYNAGWNNLITGITGSTEPASLWQTTHSFISGVGGQATWTNAVHSTNNLGISQFKNFYKAPALPAIPKSALGGGLAGPGLAAPPAAARTVAASAGTAPALGALSVPPSWAGATPAIKLASAALPGAAAAAVPAAVIPAGLLNAGALGGIAGGALGSPAARVVSSTDTRARPATGGLRKAPIKLDRVIAHLQQQPDVVQHWSVDQAGLDDLVAKLSTKPGIHAVHVSDGDGTAFTWPESRSG